MRLMVYPAVFAFGLVAFGFLGMGPVTIAVDSYGPVTDNAQSVFELSQIEIIPDIKAEIQEDFGFSPDFEKGKHFLEENDSAGNTFKATAKPVLIGTAVIGATTMIFSIILLLNLQAGSSGSPRAARSHHRRRGDLLVLRRFDAGRDHRRLPRGGVHQEEHSAGWQRPRLRSRTPRKWCSICTQYAQAGMINIFGVIFCFTLAFACFDPTFFASYLISIAVFGLFQAMFMANAGGAWDNAKKVVEVDLKEKGTPLHAATRRRRHGRRSVQGHVLGRSESDHQVHDALRPPGRGNRGVGRNDRLVHRRGLLPGRLVLRVALVLRNAH